MYGEITRFVSSCHGLTKKNLS